MLNKPPAEPTPTPSESATPETDAKTHITGDEYDPFVASDFARSLEIQRDAALLKIGEMHKLIEWSRNRLRESATPFDDACIKLSEASKLL